MNTSFERSISRTDEWYTPKTLIAKLGHFDLDPCAPCEEFYTADTCYTKDVDGLVQPWYGRVWLNPPYKNPLIGQFMKRMAVHKNGIALVFNRMDTALWHDIIFPSATAMLVMRGRIKFCDISGRQGGTSGCGSVLIAYGDDNAQRLAEC
jgi:hypothetical protein